MAADMRALADEGRNYALAEMHFQKARASYASQSIKGIAGFAVLALALVFFALMGLVVGLVIGLAGLFGPWAAAGIAFTGLLLIAALCGLVAHSKVKSMMRALANSDGGA